jgi:TPR repeat protein
MKLIAIATAVFSLLVASASASMASALPGFLATPNAKITFEEYTTVLEEVCLTGKPDYCQRLAFKLQREKDAGATKPRSDRLHQAALDYYQKQCDAADLVACQNVSIIYQVGYGRPIDVANTALSHQQFQKLAHTLCDNKDALGCFYVSDALNGTGNPDYDPNKAKKLSDLSVEYFARDCANKNAKACELLANRYNNGQRYGGYIPYDIQRAAALFDSGCQYGNADACITLGNIYKFGSGVKTDKNKAAHYDQKGCDLESAISCSNLLSGGRASSGIKWTKEQKMTLQDKVSLLARRNCSIGKLPDCSLLKFK